MKRFLLSGIGKLFIDSIIQRDYSVITALVLILGLATLIGTLISDIVMSIVDQEFEFSRKTRRKGDKMELTEEKEKKSYKKVFHQWAFG